MIEGFKVYHDPRGFFVAEGEKSHLGYLAAHIHTTFSDGYLSPERAVDKALEAGATAIAVTDHDSIAGSETARKYVRDRDLESNIQVLSGSEVSTLDGHVLAIGIDNRYSQRSTCQSNYC